MSTVSSITFPLSRIKEFKHDPSSSLRYGQAFHQFMKLEKCEQDREFCDKLYNVQSNDDAKAMINNHTDFNN